MELRTDPGPAGYRTLGNGDMLPALPADAFEQAQVLQWLFFEQYSHEPHIAVPRFWLLAGHRALCVHACRAGGRLRA